MSTPKRKKKTMMTITLMIASTTLPDTLPDLPWLKTASTIAEDTLIKMKHTACGHIANVPNWILGELAEENRISSKHGEVEIECPVCNGPRRRIK